MSRFIQNFKATWKAGTIFKRQPESLNKVASHWLLALVFGAPALVGIGLFALGAWLVKGSNSNNYFSFSGLLLGGAIWLAGALTVGDAIWLAGAITLAVVAAGAWLLEPLVNVAFVALSEIVNFGISFIQALRGKTINDRTYEHLDAIRLLPIKHIDHLWPSSLINNGFWRLMDKIFSSTKSMPKVKASYEPMSEAEQKKQYDTVLEFSDNTFNQKLQNIKPSLQFGGFCGLSRTDRNLSIEVVLNAVTSTYHTKIKESLETTSQQTINMSQEAFEHHIRELKTSISQDLETTLTADNFQKTIDEEIQKHIQSKASASTETDDLHSTPFSPRSAQPTKPSSTTSQPDLEDDFGDFESAPGTNPPPFVTDRKKTTQEKTGEQQERFKQYQKAK